jgi:type I restriction enzyme S subunit
MRQLVSIAGHGTGRLDTESIKSFPVNLPSLGEQKKIAQILSIWDKAIVATEQLLANSRQQKRALMQKLLSGKMRFPGFSGEWKIAEFEDLFRVTNDKKAQVKSSDYLEVGITPIVDQGQKAIAGYTNNDSVYEDVPVIIFGDHTRIVKWVNFPFALGADGTQVIKTKSRINLKFGYYLIVNADLPNLGYSRHMREMKEKDFKYPVEIEEQQKIALVLTTADHEIETLQQKLACLKQEKKALMQQLLTGKRRVIVPESSPTTDKRITEQAST